jgi:hypothetical protein
MIPFSTDMKSEKNSESKVDKTAIAVALLTIIIVVALATYIAAAYYPDIIENLFKEEKSIELGDLADVHYIGRYASNDSIFDSSYEDPENKIGGDPLQVFVTLDLSESPPDEYGTYSNMIGEDFVKGFIEGLIGLKIGQTDTIGPLDPEKAYGVTPKVGDIIEYSGGGEEIILKVVDIQENKPMPAELEQIKEVYGWGNITTIYVLKDESHYIGEFIDIYTSDMFGTPLWENSTTVTKINETLLWTYTTPNEDNYNNLTWIDSKLDEGYQINFPEESTNIASINETSFTIIHTPAINTTIQYFDSNNPSGANYIVENITDDKIITSLDDGSSEENRTIREFNRSESINRNLTQIITTSFPVEYMELLLSFLKGSDSNVIFNLGQLADEVVYFEVKIVDIQRPS